MYDAMKRSSVIVWRSQTSTRSVATDDGGIRLAAKLFASNILSKTTDAIHYLIFYFLFVGIMSRENNI